MPSPRGVPIFTGENYCPTKVPPHPPPPTLIWSLTMWADCVEGNASLATIGTLLVAWVFFKVMFVPPPERQTDTFPVSQPHLPFWLSKQDRWLHQRLPWLHFFPDEIDFVRCYFGASRCGRFQERDQLWHGPFACAKFAKLSPWHARRLNLECSAKRSARCNNPQIVGKKQQRFVRRGDHSKSAGSFNVRRCEQTHELERASRLAKPMWVAIDGASLPLQRSGRHSPSQSPDG